MAKKRKGSDTKVDVEVSEEVAEDQTEAVAEELPRRSLESEQPSTVVVNQTPMDTADAFKGRGGRYRINPETGVREKVE